MNGAITAGMDMFDKLVKVMLSHGICPSEAELAMAIIDNTMCNLGDCETCWTINLRTEAALQLAKQANDEEVMAILQAARLNDNQIKLVLERIAEVRKEMEGN